MYTVDYCDTFMDELLDKMGSDYFPLPIKLRRFESITLQFLRESTTFLEATQELSDDISELIVSEPKSLSAGKIYRYMGKTFFSIDYPEDYLRLLNIVPMREQSGKPVLGEKLEINIYRLGNFLTNEKNPFRKAKGQRVNIYRLDGRAIIDSDKNFKHADFTYVRVPVFGKNPTDPMLDISNKMIVDKLMHKTCVSFRATTSDEDFTVMDDYTERQGQKNK